ncbi:sensor histidine kinase [Streptomyces sp. NPDC059092]|uniref:sensor histidine kinase n=1 Tax=Streptomyces sp. NPDC059092 TaxID=3346725 RepID=UPI0036CB7527
MPVTRIRERARRAARKTRATARREVVECAAALRAAPRRTVVTEALACVLVAALALIPLTFLPEELSEERPVLAALEGLWTVVLVLGRRRHPVLAVLATAPLLIGSSVWILVAVPLIVVSATRRVTSRRAWQTVGAAGALAAVLAVADGLLTGGRMTGDPMAESLTWLQILAGDVVSLVLLMALPTLAGTLLGQRRPLVSLLRERNAYLEQARSLTAVAARMEERNRIAGEMHDLLGHKLSLISVHAGALEMAAARQAPPLAGQAELLRTTAGTAMEELREILGVLRRQELQDPSADPGSSRGTRDDITALVAESGQAGMAVTLDWSGPDTTDAAPQTRQAVHRVVRESLTNALKHASGAPTRVEVRHADGRIAVSVTNERPRVARRPQPGNRSGLVGLDERISLLGGSFGAGPAAFGGFRVEALLPVHPEPSTQPDPFAYREPSAHPARPARPGKRARGTAGGTTHEAAGAYPPLSTAVLTWPRVLGAGCAAAFVILPTVAFLVILLVMAVVR